MFLYLWQNMKSRGKLTTSADFTPTYHWNRLTASHGNKGKGWVVIFSFRLILPSAEVPPVPFNLRHNRSCDNTGLQQI
jgi:hypothetical protein